MSVIISFRIPRELKEKMNKYRKTINWSEELRKFIEKRIKELEQQKAIEELEETIKNLPQIPKGTATRYIREDRDSH